LRWSLIEVLIAEQTATATRCAALIGEAVNSCSFHLRILERHDPAARPSDARLVRRVSVALPMASTRKN
jgi:hypothetical protein